MQQLADYPAVQAKLREELQTVLSEAIREDRLPTPAESPNYLEAMLEEMLWLCVAMLIPRDAVCDTELLGRRIPKGAVMLLVCQGPDFASLLALPASDFWHSYKTAANFPGEAQRRPRGFRPGALDRARRPRDRRAQVRRADVSAVGVRHGHPGLLGPPAGYGRVEDHDGYDGAEIRLC